MVAYVQTDKNGEFYNVNAYIANEGFKSLGWETHKYYSADEITDPNPEILVVGGIGNVRKRLQNIGITSVEQEIDYPAELQQYFGRRIWESTIEQVFNGKDNWNIFIKPKETKRFPGKVVNDYKDFIGLVNENDPTAVWCSEVLPFRTEWRCFIRYGEILDIRQYKGAWDSKIDLQVVNSAIADFKSAPASYALDFGISHQGEMKLVEVNDGHSLGTYGIGVISYAKFLSARWAQLTNTNDYTRF